jgi:hypothetical protein
MSIDAVVYLCQLREEKFDLAAKVLYSFSDILYSLKFVSNYFKKSEHVFYTFNPEEINEEITKLMFSTSPFNVVKLDYLQKYLKSMEDCFCTCLPPDIGIYYRLVVANRINVERLKESLYAVN